MLAACVSRLDDIDLRHTPVKLVPGDNALRSCSGEDARRAREIRALRAASLFSSHVHVATVVAYEARPTPAAHVGEPIEATVSVQ